MPGAGGLGGGGRREAVGAGAASSPDRDAGVPIGIPAQHQGGTSKRRRRPVARGTAWLASVLPAAGSSPKAAARFPQPPAPPQASMCAAGTHCTWTMRNCLSKGKALKCMGVYHSPARVFGAKSQLKQMSLGSQAGRQAGRPGQGSAEGCTGMAPQTLKQPSACAPAACAARVVTHPQCQTTLQGKERSGWAWLSCMAANRFGGRCTASTAQHAPPTPPAPSRGARLTNHSVLLDLRVGLRVWEADAGPNGPVLAEPKHVDKLQRGQEHAIAAAAGAAGNAAGRAQSLQVKLAAFQQAAWPPLAGLRRRNIGTGSSGGGGRSSSSASAAQLSSASAAGKQHKGKARSAAPVAAGGPAVHGGTGECAACAA